MSTKLNTSGILDDVLSQIQDNSTTMRNELLTWLNIIFQKLAIERDWSFLNATSTITVISNKILKPSNYAKFIYAKKSTDWMLTEKNRLTDEEVFISGTTTATNPTPEGFSEDSTHILFHPGASGDVELKYQKEMPSYTDSSSDTLIPIQFGTLIKRALVNFYYEYDIDERMAASFQFEQGEMVKLKKWDNSQKSIPKRSKKGYMRGYL